jgi:type IV secretory pathway VirB10-like protein
MTKFILTIEATDAEDMQIILGTIKAAVAARVSASQEKDATIRNLVEPNNDSKVTPLKARGTGGTGGTVPPKAAPTPEPTLPPPAPAPVPEPVAESFPANANEEEEPKRGRGRPRKPPVPEPEVVAALVDPSLPPLDTLKSAITVAVRAAQKNEGDLRILELLGPFKARTGLDFIMSAQEQHRPDLFQLVQDAGISLG